MIDAFAIFGILFAILLRWCVSIHPFSGANKPPMYGDYEAQRHWMEITVNLSPREWYKNSSSNDLLYWGLDYPPLTAYHMFLNGQVAKFINSSWTALFTSRGLQTYDHKIFMRSTVLVSDIIIYFSGVILYWLIVEKPVKKRDKALLMVVSLIYPGLILIDHGHFQYNCVSLGLTIWSICLLERGYDSLGSIFFTLALNYKQMSLYHALPFFFYLLGKCFFAKSLLNGIKSLALISTSVLLTFLFIWWPFLTDIDTVTQVLKRLFPFNRGLYEDKVANIWCSLEIAIKLKRLLTIPSLALISLSSTILMNIPSSLHLLFNPTITNFKYALINSSLIFFLFSFQVHEKSILLVSLPVILVSKDHRVVSFWFAILSIFSLQPLLIKDDLMLPYYALTIIFIITCKMLSDECEKVHLTSKLYAVTLIGSLFGVLFLSLATNLFKPPKRYPDLFTVLNSIYSCVHFIGFTIFFHYQQLFRLRNVLFTAKSPKVVYTKIKRN